jgi:hypothetical protein
MYKTLNLTQRCEFYSNTGSKNGISLRQPNANKLVLN